MTTAAERLQAWMDEDIDVAGDYSPDPSVVQTVLDELTANTMALGSLEAEIEQAAVRVGIDLIGDDGEKKGVLQLLGAIVAALEKERAELDDFRAGWQSVFGKADE